MALCLGLALPVPCGAWGPEGHRIVAQIAWSYLTPASRAEATALLNGQTLPDVSDWADTVRRDPAYAWTAPLHYANVCPGCSEFDYQRDCPDAGCVVWAIRQFAEDLRNPTGDRARRRDALRFLVHFVADVHQPLHVAHAADRGGNDIRVEFFGSPMDLHEVWDSAILQYAGRPWREYAADLRARIGPLESSTWSSSTDPSEWATESFRLAEAVAYPIPPDRWLGFPYYHRALPVVEERLMAAGVRLGRLLNDTFSPYTGPSTWPTTTRAASRNSSHGDPVSGFGRPAP